MIAGYVVNLGMPARDHEKAIEGKIIDASPREGNAGEAAADADAERREAHRFRPR